MTTLNELDDTFIECRTRRHRWDPIPDDGGVNRRYKESRSVARLCARCERCGVMRYEAWNRITGAILFTAYKYPDGYTLTGRKTRQHHVRTEYLQRLDSMDNPKVTRIAGRRRRAS